MFPDLAQLRHVLTRLHELESRLAARAERTHAESSGEPLRDKVTALARALHDQSYWRSARERDQRHAS